MSEPINFNSEPYEIQQSVHGDRNQPIGQVLGGMVIYVSGGQAIINAGRESQETGTSKRPEIGANPYQGLMAFQETDGDRFFGRDTQVNALWEKLRHLHETESAVRLLPIYGPSGSGKSSLARAGLIPALAKRPMPGYDKARVAVLVPGTHPLEALATVLARIATNDRTPAEKAEEFERVLKKTNDDNSYEGLRRIAHVLPDIDISPLIVLVDQFEEVYTLCDTQKERDAFIANLLHAASDRAKRVTVILTLRSDFLGETQRHSVLNTLFAEQGFLVRSMNVDELCQSIAKPAEIAEHPLDTATIDLLVKDTEGREGALPLLQFALTRIWEGLAENKSPAETLQAIGGLGGALAGEAQRIYDSLDERGKAIARRLFLGLVQLGEGTKDTRRRALIDSLVSHQDQPKEVRLVIKQFAAPGVRLITLSGDRNTEMVEITHEALFDHWQQLQNWLDESRDDIRFQRRLDEAARYWDKQGRPRGSLWRSPDLDFLQTFIQRVSKNAANLQLTILQNEFCKASTNQKEEELRAEKRRIELEKKYSRLIGISSLTVATFSIAIALGSWFLSGRLADQKRTIETVFLGADTAEIIKALPKIEVSASDLQQKIDNLPASVEPEIAIAHYGKNESNFKELFAYYRNILTVINRVNIEHPHYDKSLNLQADRVEEKLAALLMKYRIPQLQMDLSDAKHSRYLNKPVTAFEHQYTKGAVRTTYEIIMTNAGAGADLNKDGVIADSQEARQIPCLILEKVEELWREKTGGTCGWHGPEGAYAPDNDCTKLNKNKSTLYTAVFDYRTDHALVHLETVCKISPR